jgi:hypothetical protein
VERAVAVPAQSNASDSHRAYDHPIAPSDEHPAMATPDPASSTEPSAGTPAAPGPAHGSERVAPLRGAGVEINGRQVARVVLGIVLATLAVLTVVFTVTGVHDNHQVDELQHQGVPVAVTITSCQGLLGGSGSNSAGFSCRGTYVLDGHRYDELLPGTAFHAPGTVVRALAVPADPTLVSPVSVVDAEHASASVFVLPALLFVALVAILAALLVTRARRRAGRGTAPA